MTLTVDEFIRRFLLHALPAGFHRIRHYGLFTNVARKANVTRPRELPLSNQSDASTEPETTAADTADSVDASATYACPDCGAPTHIIDTFLRGL